MAVRVSAAAPEKQKALAIAEEAAADASKLLAEAEATADKADAARASAEVKLTNQTRSSIP